MAFCDFKYPEVLQQFGLEINEYTIAQADQLFGILIHIVGPPPALAAA